MADRGFRVVVAGAGVSGLFMSETLKRAGKRPARSAGPGATIPFPASSSMSCRANTSFRSSRTTAGRANMRRRPRSGPTSKRSRATAASANSSASTRKSSRRGSPTVAGTSRPPRATPMSPMFSSARPVFSTGRCFRISPGATVSPARRSTRRAGTTACRMPASGGASSAAAPAACRLPRRWPGRGATSPSSSVARNGSIFATTRTRPGASASSCGCRGATSASSAGYGS